MISWTVEKADPQKKNFSRLSPLILCAAQSICRKMNKNNRLKSLLASVKEKQESTENK